MRVFATVIDSRPPYLGDEPTSLLLLPVGTRTLLAELCDGLSKVAGSEITVLAASAPGPGYESALRAAHSAVEAVVQPDRFPERLVSLEPSDWILLIDPRRIPAAPLGIREIIHRSIDDPRWVRHVVALDVTPERTKEYVQLDDGGQVRRIQRYYDHVTWPFASDVLCTFIPAACALAALDLPFGSLSGLRAALASRGVPSRDIAPPGGCFDLWKEQGLLALNERLIMNRHGRGSSHGSAVPVLGKDCQVHPEARFLGPVIIQDRAVISAGATIIGPAVLGAGSQVGNNAIVAQCVLAQGAIVLPNTAERHRVLVGTDTAELRTGATSAGVLGPMELVEETPRRRWYPRIKPLIEIPLAIAALILLSPLLLLFALLIKLDSRGPIFYSDRREGKDGRGFLCRKFRTMVYGADAQQRALLARNQMDGPQFKLDGDPRVTPLGRLLRPMSIDELPQIINVALGQMSFVGPRPSPFRENQVCVPWREGRLSVRPGITGLWQVCRHDRAAGDFHQWIYYDLLYVRFMSPLVDLKILLATLITGGGRGNVPLSWITPHYANHEPREGTNAEAEEATAVQSLRPGA